MAIGPRKRSTSRIRPPELLESRDMLSGHAFMAGFSHFLAAASGPSVQAAAHSHAFAALGAEYSDANETVLVAQLADTTTGAAASVNYQVSTRETELTVKVTGAAASSKLDVSIGGTVVGQIATDASGAGTLVLSSTPKGTELALPANFPATVVAGAAVSVGTLSGALAAPTPPTVLVAQLADTTTGAAASVKYQVSTLETELTVKVTGAAASSTLAVSIGGTVVGQVATDATGAGTLVLSSKPTGTEQALPANFPATVAAGAAVSVGTVLSGALAVPAPTSHGCHGGHEGENENESQLTAKLADAANVGASATVTYKTETEAGVTTTKLKVSVSGAAVSTTLDVAIGGVVVGKVTTDATGAGTLVLSSNPTGTQQLLPPNFPTSIAANTSVTVGSLSGTFAAGGSHSDHTGTAHARFGRHR